MSICVLPSPEPLTPASRLTETIVIESAGSESLERELRRYCHGDVEGRSFLIAGHRGAGKTTMVNQCVQKVSKAGLRYRPLLIRLHGPNLVGPAALKVGPATPEVAPPPAKQDSPVPAAAGDKKTTDNREAAAAAKGPQSDATAAAAEGAAAAAAAATPAKGAAATDPLAIAEYVRKLQDDANREEDPDLQRVQLALQQITLALHRALTQALTEGYRDRVRSGGDSRVIARRRELYEFAAQLEYELDQYTTPERLRQFWSAGGFLPGGVLPRPPEFEDQGMRELVALASSCHAYGRVSGTFAKAEVKQSISNSQSTTISTAKDGLDLISPLLSLAIGGITGTAAFASEGSPIASSAAGLMAAFGSAALFKYTSTSSRSRTYSTDFTFVPDTRVATLDRVLPTLIRRIVDIGLVPVFVIDELDKVENLYEQLESIVRHVKNIVAERAFFCFLTDRGYYERVVQVDVRDPYPKHFTYFTDRVFVSFHSDDLHAYLGCLLKTEARLRAQRQLEAAPAQPAGAVPPPGAHAVPPVAVTTDDDDLDLEVLRFVLLRRSEMHAVRLRRQIAGWSKNGRDGQRDEPGDLMLFERGVIRQNMRYRFDLLVQFAIELILHRPQIANRLRDDPAFARLLYDALYYPVRLLIRTPVKPAAGRPARADAPTVLDLNDRSTFENYLVDRMSSDPAEAKDPTAPPFAVHDVDPAFLLWQVRDLAAMLADPYVLLDELAVARSNKFTRATEAVLSALPLNPGTGPLLRARLGVSHLYDWRYDHDWNLVN